MYCSSCGVPFEKHMGIIETCLQLKEARAIICRLQEGLMQANQQIEFLLRISKDYSLLLNHKTYITGLNPSNN